MGHAILFNKMDSADPEGVKIVEANVEKHNPNAKRLYCNSPVTVEDPEMLKGKRVLVVEDGPTLTHGGMKYGAGVIAAKKYGAKELVDPRPFTVGTLTETFEHYPEIGTLLPAMGYGEQQVKDLAETIRRSDAEVVAIGTPIDLARIIEIDKPHTRVIYELEEVSGPKLKDLIREAIGG
jgi:predicted GTPase